MNRNKALKRGCLLQRRRLREIVLKLICETGDRKTPLAAASTGTIAAPAETPITHASQAGRFVEPSTSPPHPGQHVTTPLLMCRSRASAARRSDAVGSLLRCRWLLDRIVIAHTSTTRPTEDDRVYLGVVRVSRRGRSESIPKTGSGARTTASLCRPLADVATAAAACGPWRRNYNRR